MVLFSASVLIVTGCGAGAIYSLVKKNSANESIFKSTTGTAPPWGNTNTTPAYTNTSNTSKNSNTSDNSLEVQSRAKDTTTEYSLAECVNATREDAACFVLFFQQEKTCEDWEYYITGPEGSRENERLSKDLADYCKKTLKVIVECKKPDSFSYNDRLGITNQQAYFTRQAYLQLNAYCGRY